MARAKMSDLPVDPTAWMIDNDVSDFLLLHQKEVLYMCMVSVVRFVSLVLRREININSRADLCSFRDNPPI